ncbi:MAG: amidohydrolase family protein [Myxococcota bacterium]
MVDHVQPTSMHAQRVVLGDGLQEPLRVVPASVAVDGQRIVAVAEQSREQWRAQTSPADGAIDLGDRVLAPAFIDANTHLSMSAFRGLIPTTALGGNVVEDLFYRLEESLTEDDIRAFCRLGAYECLSHGVGLVWDHYYGGMSLAEGISDTGLAAVIAPTLQDLHGPGATRTEAQLDTTVQLDASTWHERGIWAALGPHATDTVSPDLWRRVAELARERSLPIHAHVAQSIQEYERACQTHGCSPVELLRRAEALEAIDWLFVHMIFASTDDLRLLDPQRHRLAYCPLSQLQFCFPAHVPSWTTTELKWVVGTDCAPSNDAMNVQRELPLVAGTRGFAATAGDAYANFRRVGGLDAARAAHAVRTASYEALASLTDPSFLLTRVWAIPGAMHPGFRAGVIAPGALANLQVLDPTHPALWPSHDVLRTLAMADTSLAIERLMVAGRWSPVVGGGLTHDAAYQDARAEADRRLSAHLRAAFGSTS